MKYADFIRQVPHGMLRAIEEVGRLNCFSFGRSPSKPDKLACWVDPVPVKKLSPMAARYLLNITSDDIDFIYRVEGVLISNIIGKGPKIFRPTVEQCKMLELVDITMQVNEYAQPFETMILELPEEVKQSKILADGGVPQIIGCHYSQHEKLFVFFVIDDRLISHKAWWVPSHDWELEEYFKADPDYWNNVGENENFRDLIRIVLNYSLLVDEYGTRRIGPDNPDYYERLQRNAKKKTHHQERNLIELATTPIRYEIDQRPVLSRTLTTSESTDKGEAPGRQISPHSRRGYYRRQHYGVGNKETKRIRIPPCIVNSHLFLGTMDKFLTTYETK